MRLTYAGIVWDVDYDQDKYGHITINEVAYKGQDFFDLLSDRTIEGILNEIHNQGRDAWEESDNRGCEEYHRRIEQ